MKEITSVSVVLYLIQNYVNLHGTQSIRSMFRT